MQSTTVPILVAIVLFPCARLAAHDGPVQASVPIFKDGEAQIVPGFEDLQEWLRHDLWVETGFDSDGDGQPDRMHVAVTRPRQTETEGLQLPVVYETSPYFAGTSGTSAETMWNPRQELGAKPPERKQAAKFSAKSRRPIISDSQIKQWVPRGYIVVHSSSPGTGLSQGCPTVGGDNESLAPKAVIDWLCGRGRGFTEPTGGEAVTAPWCTGKVGMTGTSYNGTLPLAAATTGVAGLEAIIPVAPNTSYYHYYRSHGLVRHPGGYLGEDIDVLYEFIRSGNPERREYCDCEIRDTEMAQGMDRITGDYNEFWFQRDYLNELRPMRAAMLMSHGFNDWNVMPEHSFRIYAAAKRLGIPVQIYYHQGGHGGPPPLRMMNRWFTRYLHGVRNGVEQEPRAWIVREDKPKDKPTSYVDYPHPQAEFVEFYPSSGGTGQGGLGPDQPQAAQGREQLIDNYSFGGAALAQADWTEHRLIYATPRLTAPLHISGTPRVRLRLAANKPAANLSVWLVSLPWTETTTTRSGELPKLTDNLITRGWADPQNYDSLTESEPLEPGKFYDLQFDLQPDDQVIRTGQQIGLMIFSSDREFTLHPDPGTRLTIDLDFSSLSLPIVGGAAAYTHAMERPPRPAKK